MMRGLGCILIIAFFLSGCATISQATSKNRANLLKLSIDMGKQEALGVMGSKKITSGCHFLEGESYKVVAINNPYRSETLEGRDKYKGKVLEVFYYVTDIRKNDGLISDSELTPLVFDEGKLIGWGWSFLRDNARKYEIEIKPPASLGVEG